MNIVPIITALHYTPLRYVPLRAGADIHSLISDITSTNCAYNNLISPAEGNNLIVNHTHSTRPTLPTDIICSVHMLYLIWFVFVSHHPFIWFDLIRSILAIFDSYPGANADIIRIWLFHCTAPTHYQLAMTHNHNQPSRATNKYHQ